MVAEHENLAFGNLAELWGGSVEATGNRLFGEGRVRCLLYRNVSDFGVDVQAADALV